MNELPIPTEPIAHMEYIVVATLEFLQKEGKISATDNFVLLTMFESAIFNLRIIIENKAKLEEIK